MTSLQQALHLLFCQARRVAQLNAHGVRSADLANDPGAEAVLRTIATLTPRMSESERQCFEAIRLQLVSDVTEQRWRLRDFRRNPVPLPASAAGQRVDTKELIEILKQVTAKVSR